MPPQKNRMMTTLTREQPASLPLRLPRVSRWAARYAFAILTSLVALGLSHGFNPTVCDYLFEIFQGAVVLSSWYGGLGPGIVTSSLSILALDYFFIPPVHTLRVGVGDVGRLFVFGVVAILTSSLSDQLKEAKAEVEASHDALEDRIAHRTRQLSEANACLKSEIVHRLEAEKTILEISNREQRRLGQDLHDGLCQMLAGVKFITEELKETLRKQNRHEASDAATIESRLSQALAQADNVSRGLYPVELETNGLASALKEMARGVARGSSIVCSFKNRGPVPVVDSSVATHVYRIAQEAVANALKGGKARHIHIRLTGKSGRMVLTVADNGIGLQAQAPRKGMGMKIMDYRARMINGSLDFHSRRRGCTRVRCRFMPSGEVPHHAGQA
jgi:signal transduction histidine kinase